MSYYYKYNFVSPEPIYSLVKEELKSYFDTGAIDDLLFPTYLDKCLRKLGRATYVITEEILYVEDFQARLPDNFYAVREAWMLAEIPQYPYQTANSFYSQAASESTIQVSPLVINGTECNGTNCQDPNSPSFDHCMPTIVEAVYKTNNQVARSYTRQMLLMPGNISAKQHCSLEYNNLLYTSGYPNPAVPTTSTVPGSSALDTFDIRDNKFVTNFRNGTVQLLFYATEYDCQNNQLVPDNFRIREYVEAFIKYKVFEMLSNQLTDETFDQLQKKLAYYKQLSEEAFIMADIEIKKQDAYAKQRRIKNDLNRFKMYELPNRSYRHGWRRQ